MNEKVLFFGKSSSISLERLSSRSAPKKAEWKHLFGCFSTAAIGGFRFRLRRQQLHFGGKTFSKRYHRDSAKNIFDRGDETRAGTGASEMKKATIQNIQDLHLYSTTRWILKIEICVGGESGRKEANSVSQNLWHRCTNANDELSARFHWCILWRVFAWADQPTDVSVFREPGWLVISRGSFDRVARPDSRYQRTSRVSRVSRSSGRLIAVQNLNERKLYNYHFLSCRPFFFSAPRFRRSLAFFSSPFEKSFLMKMACFLFKSSLIFLSFSLTHSMSLSWRFRFRSFNVSVSKMCRGGGRRRRSPRRTVIETWFRVMLEALTYARPRHEIPRI